MRHKGLAPRRQAESPGLRPLLRLHLDRPHRHREPRFATGREKKVGACWAETGRCVLYIRSQVGARPSRTALERERESESFFRTRHESADSERWFGKRENSGAALSAPAVELSRGRRHRVLETSTVPERRGHPLEDDRRGRLVQRTVLASVRREPDGERKLFPILETRAVFGQSYQPLVCVCVCVCVCGTAHEESGERFVLKERFPPKKIPSQRRAARAARFSPAPPSLRSGWRAIILFERGKLDTHASDRCDDARVLRNATAEILRVALPPPCRKVIKSFCQTPHRAALAATFTHRGVEEVLSGVELVPLVTVDLVRRDRRPRRKRVQAARARQTSGETDPLSRRQSTHVPEQVIDAWESLGGFPPFHARIVRSREAAFDDAEARPSGSSLSLRVF